MRTGRRGFLPLMLIGLAVPAAAAVAQPVGWYEDRRRRREYERWRAAEWHRREVAARRRHQAWRREAWEEEREREAWARRQRWYR